ncbi:hypothetical protein AVEN_183427-1 [Araneus ventricosus]|uniref:Uncharacterized protein n=1 Tax=Araneus ventricosus TaxID=182803 RepID=A0A4Y2PR23_ARAVE|nr:hypothetical protein AVEN_183427-1 [Araneus ventricosus]
MEQRNVTQNHFHPNNLHTILIYSEQRLSANAKSGHLRSQTVFLGGNVSGNQQSRNVTLQMGARNVTQNHFCQPDTHTSSFISVLAAPANAKSGYNPELLDSPSVWQCVREPTIQKCDT